MVKLASKEGFDFPVEIGSLGVGWFVSRIDPISPIILVDVFS